MAMIRHRRREGSDVDTRLLLSAGSWDDVLYQNELVDGPAQGVTTHYTLTRHWRADWGGWTRRVDAEMLAEVGPLPAEKPLAFVCGPTPFVEHVADLLVSIGHPADRVRTERFGPTGG
jgi:ferredoxin-NADP reductase